jgi:hypothetical protein
MPEGFQDKFSDSYTARVQRRMSEGIEDLMVRLDKLTSDFLGVLGKDKPKFFQSSLDNIKQITGTLRGANLLVDNADIASLCDQLELAVQYSADQLRDNQNARLAAQASFSAAATIMASLLTAQSTPSAQPAPTPRLPVEDTLEGLEIVDPEADKPSTLDPLLGPEDTPVDELLGDLMPELNEPSTVEGITSAVSDEEQQIINDLEALSPELAEALTEPAVEEPEQQEPKSMLAEIAAMDVDDEDDIDPEIASLFDL